jgi:cytochrome P450
MLDQSGWRWSVADRRCSIVPVGTVCQVPIFAGHLDPRSFSPHPRIFWPERWLPEAPELAAGLGQEFRLSQQAYMPFNYGTPLQSVC